MTHQQRTGADAVTTAADSSERQQWIGRPVLRREDRRLLTGKATFGGDVNIHGQLSVRIVRSVHAHALITAIDIEEAQAAPGVRLVLTGQDLAHLGTVLLEEIGYHEVYPQIEKFEQPVLAVDRVLYVGQPVAAVIADDAYLAEDAADLIKIDYEKLPVLLDPVEALDSAVELFPGLGNETARIEKAYGDVDGAFAAAAHVVRHEYTCGRHSGVPMETRSCVVQPDPGREVLWVWGPIHTHDNIRIISRMLSMPESSLRFRHADIGGSFGVKGGVYAEYVVAIWAARHLQRPVKWEEDRLEHMVATGHAREQVHRLAMAFDAEGRALAMRDEIFHNQGAYMRQAEPLVSDITAGIVFGPYRIPAYESVMHVVVTNKTPLQAYRAPGRYESTFARERLLDMAANRIGIDPVEIRRRNLLTQSDLPWVPGVDICFEPYHFDSGDVVQHFEEALEAADWQRWVDEAERLRAQGRFVGCGIGVLMDKAGLGLYETGGVEISPAGRVRVLSGGSSVGQGIETVLAQIVAEELQMEPETIDVVHGDSELVPEGVGSWSSRSTVLAGGAARQAALEVVAKARRLAADMLEVDQDDLDLVAGRMVVRGTDTGLSLMEIAGRWDGWTARLAGDEPGLSIRTVYCNSLMNYPYGVTMVMLEFLPETGGHRFLEFFTTSETGRIINPLTTRGQVIGAAIQGIGGALYEEFVYEPDGQPVATSFKDYLLPAAAEMPNVGLMLTEHAPSPDNPLRAKGLGEVGIIAVGAAVANAFDDAFRDGAHVDRLPIGPEQIYRRYENSRNPVV